MSVAFGYHQHMQNGENGSKTVGWRGKADEISEKTAKNCPFLSQSPVYGTLVVISYNRRKA